MPFADIYRRQVALLVRLLPFIADETCFALKGGTAINLFVRNMPRLSVDIDLTYVPVQPRKNPRAPSMPPSGPSLVASRKSSPARRSRNHGLKLRARASWCAPRASKSKSKSPRS